MIAGGLLLASSLAGAAYTLTPGPGFVAMVGIGAAQGRRAGAMFIFGHFLGDVTWSALALVAILGAHQIGTLLFDVLGLVCGLYLARLGWGAVTMRARGDAASLVAPVHPLRRGMVFGLTNPKAYPVAVATFTALLAGQAAELGWSALPWLLGAACCGVLLADLVLVAIAGAETVRSVYRRHEVWVVRASGLVFLAFAAAALAGAVPGLMLAITS